MHQKQRATQKTFFAYGELSSTTPQLDPPDSKSQLRPCYKVRYVCINSSSSLEAVIFIYHFRSGHTAFPIELLDSFSMTFLTM